VNWSGFGSQGNGACFTARIDIIKCCNVLFKYNADLVAIASELHNDYHIHADVVRCGLNNRYAHDKTCEVGLSSPSWDDMSKLQQDKLEELEKELTGWVRSECRALYNMLEQYYFEEQDPATIVEDLSSLGEVYDKSGQIIETD